MINCFLFCFNFAFKYHLRRFIKAVLVAAGLGATSSAAVTVAAVKTTFVDIASPPPPLVLNVAVAASTESWMTPGLNWFTGLVGGRV